MTSEADRAPLEAIDHRIQTCWSQQGPFKVYDDARELRRLLREAEAERDAIQFELTIARKCNRHLAEALDQSAARDRAVAEARRLAIEECAKEVCVGCREGIPLGATVSSCNAIAVFHLSPSGMNLLPCVASGIRALLNEADQ